MAFEVGDLWPFVSGQAALGAEMSNRGYTGEIRPFASMHMHSGVFYGTNGQSGIIRFENQQLGFSFNGGEAYPLIATFHTAPNSNYGAKIEAPLGLLRLASRSGITIEAQERNILIHAADGDITLDATGLGTANMTLFSDDVMHLDAEGSLAIDALDMTVTSADSIFISTTNAETMFQALIQGQIQLFPWGQSGSLNYQFGPHQSWYMKTTHSSTGGPLGNGQWPIAHSGNVLQMIQERQAGIGSGLQSAYQTRRLIVMTSNPGDLQLISNTAKTKFSTFGTQAELGVSGLFAAPTLANLERGDIYMMNYSVPEGVAGTTTEAIARARALGPGTLVINTGSGIANVSIGSGLAMFSNTGTQTITTALTTLNLNAVVESADQNYSLGTVLNSGVVNVYSPGLYKVSYKVTYEKTVGTTPQITTTRLEKNNDGAAVFGSVVNTFHFDNANASDGSAGCVLLINLDAGENLRLKGSSTLAGANNVRLANRGATLVIEKIGPMRGTAGS